MRIVSENPLSTCPDWCEGSSGCVEGLHAGPARDVTSTDADTGRAAGVRISLYQDPVEGRHTYMSCSGLDHNLTADQAQELSDALAAAAKALR